MKLTKIGAALLSLVMAVGVPSIAAASETAGSSSIQANVGGGGKRDGDRKHKDGKRKHGKKKNGKKHGKKKHGNKKHHRGARGHRHAR